MNNNNYVQKEQLQILIINKEFRTKEQATDNVERLHAKGVLSYGEKMFFDDLIIEVYGE